MRRTVQVREAVTEQKVVTTVVQHAVVATRCNACQRLFVMHESEGGDDYRRMIGLSKLEGSFECQGASVSSDFEAYVCSFACADALFRGGWRAMPEYERQAESPEARVWHARLSVTPFVTFYEDNFPNYTVPQ